MARNSPPSFDFYVDDFIGGTLYMTTDELAVYLLLMIHQWHYGHVPDDESWWRRIIGNRMEWDPKGKETVRFVLDQKFEKKGGKFFNSRMGQEREKQHKRYRANVQNGRKGGRPKKLQDDGNENPNETHGLTQKKPSGKGEVGRGKTEVGRGSGKREVQSHDIPIPEPLDTPEFRAAWLEWLEYKLEIKKPYGTERGVKAQLSRLAKWGSDRAVAAIEHSIGQEYQGIYEPGSPPRNQQADDPRGNLEARRKFLEGE